MFKGQVWVLWSNGKLAQACIRMFDNRACFNSSHPTHAEVSRRDFHWAQPGPYWYQPKYQSECWNHRG